MGSDRHCFLARGDTNFSGGMLPAEPSSELAEIKKKEKMLKLWNYSLGIIKFKLVLNLGCCITFVKKE